MEGSRDLIDSSSGNLGTLAREIVPDLSNFKKYTRTKQSIAYEIRALTELLRKHFGDRESEECRELMVKLTEDRFTLAVVGQFKRGKSSLMNAIIGQDLLPTGVLPLTSAITMLQYGPEARLLIYRQGLSYPQEAALQELSDYVTEEGNPGNNKGILKASIELPLALLRRGMEFVDTPGIGSAIEANTMTTQRFLPKSDAVIFVTSVDSPLTQAESEFLRLVREHVRKIFFVVNKIDLATAPQRQEVHHFVENRIREITGADQVKLFPVSSLKGLEAKLAGKKSDYEASGLSALEEALTEFLSKEKSSTFLMAVLDKLDRLLQETIQQVQIIKTAAEVPRSESQETLSALQQSWQELTQARRQHLHIIKEELNRQMQADLSDDTAALLEEVKGTFHAKLDEALSRSSWRLSYFAVQGFTESLVAEVRHRLIDWTSEQRRRLVGAFDEALRQSWTTFEDNLQQITRTAASTLHMERDVEFSLNDELQSGIPQPHLQPGPIQFDWRPKTPSVQSYLPVFLTRSVLKKRFLRQVNLLIQASHQTIAQAMEESIEEGTRQIGADLDKRANAVEARIIQAMKGKKLVRRIDGRWQLSDFDAAELSQQLGDLQAIEQRVVALQNEVALTKPFLAEPPIEDSNDSASAAAALNAPTPRLRAAARKIAGSPDDLLQSLQTRGCPACDAMFKAAQEFFAEWQYALSAREDAQKSYASSFGFCPLHTWQMAALSSPQGLSQGLPKLMERLSNELQKRGAKPVGVADSAKALVNRSTGCQVCRLVKETETAFIQTLSDLVQTERGQKAYAASQGVCLRHLELLLGAVSSNQTAEFLLAEAARRFAEIAEDMQSYAIKRDAREGYTLNQDEKDAWWRGLVHSVGDGKVSVGWDSQVEL